ncbi:chromate transporter [Helicovermis profundi]|uniref:Chromate transporter n=1 Tax=Helicovermis profundi TaxID=3065157 RepID=A0AAU9E9L4_9FIRM|nr:chromate transporter [Clostridia bacterium S502]
MIIRLFLIFLKIGLFSFGGGYAMLPFIQNEIVNTWKWIDIDEFVNIIAVSQMTPGPIAVNSATYVGVKTAGFFGAVFSTLGVVIGSFVLVILISKKLETIKKTHILNNVFRGLRPTVIALITTAAYSVAKLSVKGIKDIIIIILVFILSYKYKLHPIILIIISAFIGVVLY